MKTSIRKLLLFLCFVFVGAALYGFYLFNKRPADIRKSAASYSLSADSLLHIYDKDEARANKQFLNEVIAVSGVVSRVIIGPARDQATVMLSTIDPLEGVTCSFYDDQADALKKVQQGQEITVKGVCTGKLMDVVLNKCSIQN